MCEKKQLLVGFAKVDITPDYPVRLAGYSDDEKRISQMVVEHIYTTCIAVSEGDETILIYTNDNLSCNHYMAENIRLAVTAATGIAGEKIFCAATHCHSCPGYGGEPNTRYRNQWIAGTVEAAKLALADQAPARMLAGTKDFPGMITMNPTGTYLWEQLTEQKTEADLVQALLDRYEVTEAQAQKDVSEFVKTLTLIGAIQ